MTEIRVYPGSPDAVRDGCTCSPERNHHGAGEPINDGANVRTHIARGCQLHSSFSLPVPVEQDVFEDATWEDGVP